MPHAQLWSRPGTVVVEFLPPIATDDFTLDNLHDRSEALRALFLAALARAPAA
jgi:1-acyl-sn-glycerol-3-phosphate acyltransferase